MGTSALTTSFDAGVAAAAASVIGDDPRLLIVFASSRHDLGQLLAGIRSVSGETPLIGCTTAGEIAGTGPADSAVVVTALGGAGFSIATAVARGASDRLRDAGEEVGAAMDAVEPLANRVLMLLTDGLAGDQQEIVRGAYAAVGAAVPLVGGCAGDDLAMRSTHQFHGAEVLTNAVVAAAIASDGPIGIGVRHGWRRVGEPMLVTSSSGTRVNTLDDRPALDVYLDRLDPPDEARTDPTAFTQFAITHPLGLSRRSGEEVRFIAEADFDTRSLVSIAEVRQGGLAWSMEGDVGSILDAVDDACSDALAPLGETPPVGMIAFDCIARRGVLGESLSDEVARLAAHAPGIPVAGFYTYGEIARTHGMSGFHNQTLVVLALG